MPFGFVLFKQLLADAKHLGGDALALLFGDRFIYRISEGDSHDAYYSDGDAYKKREHSRQKRAEICHHEAHSRAHNKRADAAEDICEHLCGSFTFLSSLRSSSSEPSFFSTYFVRIFSTIKLLSFLFMSVLFSFHHCGIIIPPFCF